MKGLDAISVKQAVSAGETVNVRLDGTTPGPFRETRNGWMVLGVVWGACAVYLGMHLRQGWTPCDAGVLAQSAERVLQGQLPHRDFQEIYTGGLTYLNALAFRFFGTDLFSLRIPFFLFFVGWVPAVYSIARRLAQPITAGAITLLGVSWGPVVYPEAMASWYNLFFATWGVLALLRYSETRRQTWLWVAGLCAGLSFLVKLSGLYFVFAALLFFVFREQVDAGTERKNSPQATQTNWFYQLFRGAGLLVFLFGLTITISAIPAVGDYIYFVLPSACLVAFLLWAGRVRSSIGSLTRIRRLLSMALPFLAAAFLPVGAFLAWYVHEGALADWYRGTFLGPIPREYWAGGPVGLLILSYGIVPLVLALLLAYDSNRFSRRFARVAVPVGLGAVLLAAWKGVSILFDNRSFCAHLGAIDCGGRAVLPDGGSQSGKAG